MKSQEDTNDVIGFLSKHLSLEAQATYSNHGNMNSI